MLAPVLSAVLVRLPVKNLPVVLLSSYKLTWGEGLQFPECLPWAHSPDVKCRCEAFWGVMDHGCQLYHCTECADSDFLESYTLSLIFFPHQ